MRFVAWTYTLEGFVHSLLGLWLVECQVFLVLMGISIKAVIQRAMSFVLKMNSVSLGTGMSVAFIHQAANNLRKVFEVICPGYFDALVLLNGVFKSLHSKLGQLCVT